MNCALCTAAGLGYLGRPFSPLSSTQSSAGLSLQAQQCSQGLLRRMLMISAKERKNEEEERNCGSPACEAQPVS